MKTFTKTLFLLLLMIMSSAGAWASVAEVWQNGSRIGSYGTFKDACYAANGLTTSEDNPATIKLLSNANAFRYFTDIEGRNPHPEAYVDAGHYIIFDGNGHTLTLTYECCVDGTLVVSSGIITGSILINGDLNVMGGTIGCCNINYGTMNVSGGTINGNIQGYYGYGTVNVSGGTVNGCINIRSGTVNVSGGTIDGGSNTGGAINAIEETDIIPGGGAINITGGEIKGAEYAVKSGSSLINAVTITGGTIYKGSVGSLYMVNAVNNALATGYFFNVQDSSSKWVRYTPASDATTIDQTIKIIPYGVQVWQDGELKGTYYSDNCFWEAWEYIRGNLTSSEDNPTVIKLLSDVVAHSRSEVLVQESQMHIAFEGGEYTLTLEQEYWTNSCFTLRNGTITGDFHINSTMNVNGGAINGHIYLESSPAIVNVTGGKIDAGNDVGGAINAQTAGKINISGGEITGAEYAVKSESISADAVVLTGGVLTKSGDKCLGALYLKQAVSNTLASGKGFYEPLDDAWVYYTGDVSAYTINKTVKIADYVTEENAVAKVSVDGKTVYRSSSLTDVFTLATACAKSSDATITLLSKNYHSEEEGMTIGACGDGKKVVFDLNNNILYPKYKMTVGGTLEITNGKIYTENFSAYDEYIKVTGGLTLKEPLLLSNSTQGVIGLYQSGELTVDGDVELCGGNGYTISAYNASNKICLNGGKIEKGYYGSIYLNYGTVKDILGTGKMFYNSQDKVYSGDLTSNVIKETVSVKDPTAFTVTAGTNGYTTYSQNYNFTVGDGVKVFKAAAPDDNNTVTMKEVTGVIPANTGVILRTYANEENISVTPTFSDATAVMDGNTLVAVKTGDSTWATGTNYVLMSKDTYTKFFATDGSASTLTALAGKCYLNVPLESAKESLDINWDDDDTTGVGQIENGKLKMENSGKYIENSHIVIMKNGMKYNTAGQRVF